MHNAIRPGQVFDGFHEVDETFNSRVLTAHPRIFKPREYLMSWQNKVLFTYMDLLNVEKEDPNASYFDNVYCATRSTLWGRGVTEVGIGENTAFACNKFGEIFGWGGRKHLWEKILPGSRWARENRGEMTHRSQVLLGIKGRLPWLAQEIVRERAREARRLAKLEEDESFQKMICFLKKKVVITVYLKLPQEM